jgi:hypothetical protein
MAVQEVVGSIPIGSTIILQCQVIGQEPVVATFARTGRGTPRAPPRSVSTCHNVLRDSRAVVEQVDGAREIPLQFTDGVDYEKPYA